MSHLSIVPGLSFSSVPPPTAAELLASIRERGGRVYRMREARVFCLTDSAELAEWLQDQGGSGYTPSVSYQRAKGGTIEYDVWIHRIPTSDRTLWQELG